MVTRDINGDYVPLDDDVRTIDEPMPADDASLDDILEELQSQTQSMKDGMTVRLKGEEGLFKPSSVHASTAKETEEQAEGRKAIAGGVKGIKGTLDVISSQLAELPSHFKATGAAGVNAVGGQGQGNQPKGLLVTNEDGKVVTAKEWLAGREDNSKDNSEDEGEADKEKRQQGRWDAFTRKSRQKNKMLRNKGTDALDARIAGMQDQASQWSNTFHALGMHSIGDRLGSLAEEGGMLEMLGARLFLPALAVYGGLELAGKGVQAIRNTRNRDIDQSINAAQAGEETAANGVYDFLHKFGFSAISGRDLTAFREADLSNNWALFGRKADANYEADKTLTDRGWSTDADKAWAAQMVEMGASAGQVKSQFMSLVQTAKTMGISFKNLSGTIAQVATDASKQLGKKAASEVVKSTPEALKELQDFGMRGNKATFDNLTQNGAFEWAERIALAEAGKGQIGMEAGTPGLLAEETLAQGPQMFASALNIYKQQEGELGYGSELQYASNLAKQGIATNNIMNETQMYQQSVQTLHVTVSASPELSAKVAKNNAYAQAINGQWDSYYNVANYGKGGGSQ